MAKVIDISGEKFNRLTALKFSHIQKGHHYWFFRCDCGTEKIICKSNVLKGVIKSCGCHNKQKAKKTMTTHGLSRTRLYNVFRNIKTRCDNKNNKAYKHYGARGISVCDEWNSDFISFYNWANENGYKDNLTIDRISNNEGYCPKNCRWVDMKAQQRNKRNNTLLSVRGKTKCISEWCEIYDIKANTLIGRIKAGWSIEKAVTTKTRRTQ